MKKPMKNAARKQGIFHPMTIDPAVPTAAEPSSFETLFHEHWAHVYRALLRLVGDPAEAEDLALETFFRLYDRPPAAAPELNVGGWLHRVATNLGLHSIRSFKRREHYELTAGRGALETAPNLQPAELLEGEEKRRMARLALAAMNPRQAELLALRYSGASYKEIAAALGTSSTSIGPLLLRAEHEFEKRYRALYAEEV
jgi:RNA polymerase sigma-70 factor (ECF subfamily)